MAGLLTGCAVNQKEEVAPEVQPWSVDRFADIEVLRYEVPAFEELPLAQKELIYYLTEAAQWGRDILWDQNCRFNLPIRNICEAIYLNYQGDKTDAQWKAFEQYMKQIWFANGIHHHYSSAKFNPEFTQEWFEAQISQLPETVKNEELQQNLAMPELMRAIFDPSFMAIKTNQADGVDLIATSANNYYEGVTQKEVENYYARLKLRRPAPWLRTQSRRLRSTHLSSIIAVVT